MRWLIVGIAAVHGLIHFMGPAKAFGWAELPQLTQPISRAGGILWLAAGLASLATALVLAQGVRWWWIVGMGAVVLSQAAIMGSWTDAWAGTIANVILLGAVVYGFAAEGPRGLRAEYRVRVEERMAAAVTPADTTRATATPARITEGDLDDLPPPLQRYLRLSGAVGQERVRHFRAVWRGRIRSGPEDPWMEFAAEQYNFVDPPARFFLMDARKGGLPVDVLHAFEDGHATMRVLLASLLPLVDARGPEMDRAETVTVFNDLCLFAPWALLDADVRWEAVDERSVRGRFTLGENTVSALLTFNEAGELVDFVSDDRMAASPDGKSFEPLRWSTPVAEYRSFGALRVMSRGQGLWHPTEGAFAYFEGELLEVEMNPDQGPTPDGARYRRVAGRASR